MLDTQLREVKEKVLVPFARLSEGIHPTWITLAGGGLGLAAGLAALQGWYAAGLVLWLLNRVVDGLDGTVARLHGKQSQMGGYIDTLIDHVIYAFIPFMLVLSQPSEAGYMALIFMLSTYYVNAASWMYLASILEQRREGAKMRGEMTTIVMPISLIEGAETVVFYLLLFVLPGLLVPLFVTMGILLIITVVQRLVWAAAHID